MKLVYPAVFTPCEESSGFTVTVPNLPGCVTQGDTLADAIDMATEAASGWVLDELEDGNSIPPSSALNEIKCSDKQFANLLVLDMDAYAINNSSKAVRKNCTIPAWLNDRATRQNVNFSAVLQRGLMQELHLDNRP